MGAVSGALAAGRVVSGFGRLFGRRDDEKKGSGGLWLIAVCAVMLLPGILMAVLVPVGLVVGAMIGGASKSDGGGCGLACPLVEALPLSGSKQDLAKLLILSGKLHPLPGAENHITEIEDIAAGTVREDCDVDVRILTILGMLTERYDSIGISDINRKCTAQSTEGGGTLSSHWRDGGGMAIDFYAINGVPLTGGDQYSLEIITLLDPLVPEGSRVGQNNCRSNNTFVNFTTFYDPCHHLHLDVAFAQGNGGLPVADGSAPTSDTSKKGTP